MTLPAVAPTEPRKTRLTSGERRMIEQRVKVGGGISRKMAQQLLAEIDRLQRPDMDLAYSAGFEDGEMSGAATTLARIRHEFRDLPLIVAAIDAMGET